MKIFIDAGHNFSGCDTGAVGNGLYEQNVTFDIADKLKKILISFGHDVKMSRDKLTDNIGKTTSESLKARCVMANEWGADLFCSIHANAGGGKGTEVYVYSKKSDAYSVAEKVLDGICDNLKTTNRGVKEGKKLAVLKGTKMPAILIETAFIDNKEDAKKLKEKADLFAASIAEAITGKKEKEELTEVLDIVYELAQRGIITNEPLWIKKLNEDINCYHLARKCAEYMKKGAYNDNYIL